MKLYVDKAKGKSYFYYFGWTIIVFLGAFFLLFFLLFQLRFYVRRTERVEFFIAAHGLKQDFGTEIQKEFKDKGLVEANIYFYTEDDPNVYNYFSANGENADYVIFSETNVKDMQDYVPGNYLNVESLKNDVPSIAQFEYYQFEGTSYAIKIFDDANETYNSKFSFIDIFEFTKQGKENESYYLLVDNQSPNFDKQNNHTLGYEVLEYFLSSMIK